MWFSASHRLGKYVRVWEVRRWAAEERAGGRGRVEDGGM